jgi:hypothetical protein
MDYTPILKITDTDVVTELNALGDIGLPRSGGQFGIAKNVIMSFALRGESITLSNIPEMYRQMTREVRGEIVVESAYGGQNSLSLGLSPVVENSVALYVDFGEPSYRGNTSSIGAINIVTDSGGFGSNGRTPYTFRTWADRLPQDNYAVDLETGVVTLNEALKVGSKVYADYKHEGMHKCANLRDIAIQIAAARLAQSLATLTEQSAALLRNMKEDAEASLMSLMSGTGGIDLLDNLKLVDETRQGSRIPRKGFALFM